MTKQTEIESYISQFSFLTSPEIAILRILYDNSKVDKESYFVKLRQAQDNLKALDNAIDIITELKAASEFLDLANLDAVQFDENPDFHLQIDSRKIAVEVKNFRYRIEDSVDDSTMRKAVQRGVLATYGNPAKVQEQIEDAIIKKVRNYNGSESFFLYFWSHSPHHVEDLEIECAAKVILYDYRYSKLMGLFYKFNNYTCFVYTAQNQSENVQLFGNRFFHKIL